MYIAFSFKINEDKIKDSFNSETEFLAEMSRLENEIKNNDFVKSADHFYTSNKSNVVLLVVLLQNLIKEFPWFEKNASCVTYYRIEEVSSFQELFNRGKKSES